MSTFVHLDDPWRIACALPGVTPHTNRRQQFASPSLQHSPSPSLSCQCDHCPCFPSTDSQSHRHSQCDTQAESKSVPNEHRVRVITHGCVLLLMYGMCWRPHLPHDLQMCCDSLCPLRGLQPVPEKHRHCCTVQQSS